MDQPQSLPLRPLTSEELYAMSRAAYAMDLPGIAYAFQQGAAIQEQKEKGESIPSKA